MHKSQLQKITFFVFFSLLLGGILLTASPSLAKPLWSKVQIDGKHTIEVEVVISREEQALGLGNRKFLAEGKGMLFLYPRPQELVFWMKRMYIAIDIIWIRNGKVVHIERDVPPPSLQTQDRNLKTYGKGVIADTVLEVSKNYSQKISIQVGSSVQFR